MAENREQPAKNREELLATLNKASIQIKNGKDSTASRRDFANQLRKAGFTDKEASQFEGRK